MVTKTKSTNSKKAAAKKPAAKKPAAKKPAAKKVVAKKPVAKKAVAKKVVAKKPAPKKAVVKKVVAKKPAAKKAVAKKPVAKKPAAKKVVAKKSVAKKPAAKKVVAKKVVAKKVVAKKPVAKAVVKKAVATKSVAKVDVKKVITKKPEAKPIAKKATPAIDKERIAKVAERKRVDAGNFAIASMVPQKTVAEKIEAKKAHPMRIERGDIKANLLGPVDWIPAYKAKPGEEYMNDQQLEHFKYVLTEWKKELTRSADITVGHMKEDVENYSDMADRATHEEEFSLELRTRDREYKLLKKIDEAIMKIKDGSFGYCDSCGVEIGLPRLEVRPTATLCIDCKTVEEIRERQLTF